MPHLADRQRRRLPTGPAALTGPSRWAARRGHRAGRAGGDRVGRTADKIVTVRSDA
ncbi:hypothetical protein [Micromonospora humi]|uniref:hypothetical protein n=1 Tax=Micromonospora humi TaxID=745366 RepID=UPI001586BD76|nr:hypothetical protein [Micromonospora humi]